MQLAALHAESSDFDGQAGKRRAHPGGCPRTSAPVTGAPRKIQNRKARRPCRPADRATDRLDELRHAVQSAAVDVQTRQRAVEAIQTEVGLRQQERTGPACRAGGVADIVDANVSNNAPTSRAGCDNLPNAAPCSREHGQHSVSHAAEQDALAAETALTGADQMATTLEAETQSAQTQLAALEAAVAALQQELRVAESSRQEADRLLIGCRRARISCNGCAARGTGYASGVRAVP